MRVVISVRPTLSLGLLLLLLTRIVGVFQDLLQLLGLHRDDFAAGLGADGHVPDHNCTLVGQFA